MSKWHHLWIDFRDISADDVRVYVDGKQVPLQQTGSLPTPSSSWPLFCEYSINKNLESDETYFSRSATPLKEIIVIEGALNDINNDLKDIINYGFNSLLLESVTQQMALPYLDESTKTINTVLSQKKTYLAGTNYGDLLEAVLAIWETRWQFEDANDLLGVTFGNNSSYKISDGFLSLSEGSIVDL